MDQKNPEKAQVSYFSYQILHREVIVKKQYFKNLL